MNAAQFIPLLAEFLGDDLKTLRVIDRALADNSLRKKAPSGRTYQAMTRREALYLLLASLAGSAATVTATKVHRDAAAWAELKATEIRGDVFPDMAGRPLIEGLEVLVEQVASGLVLYPDLDLELHLLHGLARIRCGESVAVFTGPDTRRNAGRKRLVAGVDGRVLEWIGENLEAA